MSVTLGILKALSIGIFAFIVICFVPVVLGMSSVLLADLLGCDFNNETATTALCEPAVVRNTIQHGTMLNWYGLATLPMALIAAVALLLVIIARFALKAFAKR